MDGQKRKNRMLQLELNHFGTTMTRSPTTMASFSKDVESLYLPPCAKPCWNSYTLHTSELTCKRRARDIIFWPGMNAEIKAHQQLHYLLHLYKRNNPREHLLPHSIPKRPWEKVGRDLCEFEGQHYLIMVDYYSNFIEADRLRQTTSEHVIEICKSQFTINL